MLKIISAALLGVALALFPASSASAFLDVGSGNEVGNGNSVSPSVMVDADPTVGAGVGVCGVAVAGSGECGR